MFAFYRTTIGKKMVMAVTGMVLFLFVFFHMLGNLKIFQGLDKLTGQYKMDLYGHFLREVGQPLFGHGELLWIARIVLLACLGLHVYSAFQLTRLKRKARPIGYTQQKLQETTYAARTMWLGGVILLIYLVYHILHFTTGTLHFRGFQTGAVYANVFSAFQVWYVSLIYVFAMGFLCLHIDHGFWSAFQTLGLNSPSREAKLKLISRSIAIVIFLGFISVPIGVFLGFVPGP